MNNIPNKKIQKQNLKLPVWSFTNQRPPETWQSK